MSDEAKSPDGPVPPGEKTSQSAPESTAAGQMSAAPTAEAAKPAVPAPATAAPAKPTPVAAAAKPAAPGTAAAKPAAPGTAAAKPAVPPRPAPPPPVKPEPWNDEFSSRVREALGDAVKDSLTFQQQKYFIVEASAIRGVCEYLKYEEQFEMLVDLTAVDYPKREKRFEIVYQLYSFARNMRLRLKAAIGENQEIESMTAVWPAANWLEREAYDMFGVRFSGHPDLKRILLPDGWEGHPLRKDYPILQQDQRWVQENLHIESGQ